MPDLYLHENQLTQPILHQLEVIGAGCSFYVYDAATAGMRVCLDFWSRTRITNTATTPAAR